MNASPLTFSLAQVALALGYGVIGYAYCRSGAADVSWSDAVWMVAGVALAFVGWALLDLVKSC